MFPATRSLVEYMRESEPEFYEEPAAHEDRFDPQVLQLQIKKKRQLEMIKKMLEQGGYEDLARMTTLRRRDFDADVEE